MKPNLSLAVLAAVAVAVAASSSEAATKKKGKGNPKVTVTKQQSYWAGQFNSCASMGSRMWYPVAAVGAVGCGIVYAVPTMIEGFWIRRA